MISNDEELLEITTDVGEKIQQIHDYLGERNHPNGAIKFPRGYLRRCVEHRKKYDFISDHILKSNIAYTLLQTDLFRWLLNRTDISGQAKEMLIKKEISSIGAIIESITKHYLHGRRGGGKNYKYRSNVLVDEGIITKELKINIDWVWDVRSGEHLMLLEQREWKVYEMKDCNKAIRTLHELRNKLNSHNNKGGF
ncbi:MAG: hypothetical protein QM484_01310 [Woeseiaceae bacterium]